MKKIFALMVLVFFLFINSSSTEGVQDQAARASNSSINQIPQLSCPTESLILLAAGDLKTMDWALTGVQERGGCVVHIYPPSAWIGSLNTQAQAWLADENLLAGIYKDRVDRIQLAALGENARIAAQAWNASLTASELPVTLDDKSLKPLVGDVLSLPIPPSPAVGATPLAPGYYNVSEFLYGKVAVGIILPESSGGTDPSTENWSESRMDQVIGEIQAAMTWYSMTFPQAQLSFTYDIHKQVSTKYEPINRPSSEDSLWLHEAFTNLGIVGGNWYSQAYEYLNGIRTTYNTDWAIVVYVVDSLNDIDGSFSNGYFGYTYGNLIVMSYDNDGWGIDNMDSVMAHETAHNFGAGDEYCAPGYACCWGGGQLGYLGIPNSNCVAGCDQNDNGTCDGNDSDPDSDCHNCPTCVVVDCIMLSGTVSSGMDEVSRQQIGARDSDSDGLYDPVDTFPSLTFSPFTPDPTNDNTPTYTGSAIDIPYDSPVEEQADLSINDIERVQYQIDGNIWQDCTSNDGAFDDTSENFSCTTSSLVDGTHTIGIRAVNRVGNNSAVLSDTLSIDATPPSNPIVVNSSHDLSTWANDATIDVTWSGASDGAGTGVNGYSFAWSTSPDTLPNTSVDTTGTAATSPVLSSGNTWYFHIRTRDNTGNWNSTATHYGPFYIDLNPPSSTVDDPSLAGCGFYLINWSGSDGESGLGSYDIQYRSGLAGSWTDWFTATVQTSAFFGPIDPLAPAIGETYYFRSRAWDLVGNTEAFPDGNGDALLLVDDYCNLLPFVVTSLPIDTTP